jgi:hypothetical protein
MGGGIRSLELWTEDKQTRNFQQLRIKWDAQVFLDATNTMTTGLLGEKKYELLKWRCVKQHKCQSSKSAEDEMGVTSF